MATLIKSDTGLIFYDDFKEKTLMWTLSPSNAPEAIEFDEKGLHIKHTDRYVIYTMVEPEAEEYSCIVDLEHVPFNFDDIAGVIILSSNKEYAECQSYKALTPSGITGSQHYYDDVKALIHDAVIGDFVEYKIDNGEEEEGCGCTPMIPPVPTEGSSSGTLVVPATPSPDFVDTMYRYIKFIKLKYKYLFYASEDGYTWIDVGNVSFDDSGVIGFFLYDAKDDDMAENSHFWVHNIALYKSKYINIQGIGRDRDMELIDGNGVTLLRTDGMKYLYLFSRVMKTTLINTTTLPMPIKDATLRVYPRGDYGGGIKEYKLGDLYGGDEFTIQYDLRLFIDKQELNPNTIYDLGTFYHGSYYVKVDVHNFDEELVAELKLKVIRYSEYYGGEEEVNIALYDEKRIESDLDYEKEIIIDLIRPSESRSFFMKLMDRAPYDYYMTANDYRFKIVMDLG